MTPARKEVVEEMIPYLTENFGNPSSIYEIGKISKHAIDKARKKVADALGAEENKYISHPVVPNPITGQ